DYVKERNEMLKFRNSFEKEFPNIHVPRTFEPFCSDSILTMEFLDGDDFEETLKYSQEERDFLGQLLFDSYIYSLFR
ncbi:MAG: AarF/UbiB family protein, partial [Bdellovibrionota bacterium]|nr:AarF/UbiB family protein [Bdellovibrionota bacterium]